MKRFGIIQNWTSREVVFGLKGDVLTPILCVQLHAGSAPMYMSVRNCFFEYSDAPDTTQDFGRARRRLV
jgi:hypothetical protein